jgi:hypothetical protein
MSGRPLIPSSEAPIRWDADGRVFCPGVRECHSRHRSYLSPLSSPTLACFSKPPRGLCSTHGFLPAQREDRAASNRTRSALVPALDCQSCGAIASGDRYTYEHIVCETCGEQNLPGWRRMVPCAWLQPREIYVTFIPRNGYSVQAMDLDCRTILGPYVPRQSPETLRRLLAYLGAMPEQLADFDQSIRSWGQGTARITLEAGRKNLLCLRA